MKWIAFYLSLCVIVCSGCANQYIIKMNNGLQVTSNTKPKLKGGYYEYTDPSGRTMSVPAGRVREIEPASMAKEEMNQFRPNAR